jgi:tetratricopeptide (TPR) repeat protein
VAVDKEERAKQAMALHDEAWALYEEGHYRVALERLEAALRIDPEGRELVFNLALLHEKLGDLHEAIVTYRRYAEMEPDPKARARTLATIHRLEGAERDAIARAAATPLGAPAPAAPRGMGPMRRSWVIATAGLSTAAFVTGVGFGLTALQRNPGANARTGNGVTIDTLQAEAHAAHTDAVVADVAFVVSAVAAATAALLYTTGTNRAPRSASTLVFAGPGAGASTSHAGLGVTF